MKIIQIEFDNLEHWNRIHPLLVGHGFPSASLSQPTSDRKFVQLYPFTTESTLSKTKWNNKNAIDTTSTELIKVIDDHLIFPEYPWCENVKFACTKSMIRLQKALFTRGYKWKNSFSFEPNQKLYAHGISSTYSVQVNHLSRQFKWWNVNTSAAKPVNQFLQELT